MTVRFLSHQSLEELGIKVTNTFDGFELRFSDSRQHLGDVLNTCNETFTTLPDVQRELLVDKWNRELEQLELAYALSEAITDSPSVPEAPVNSKRPGKKMMDPPEIAVPVSHAGY